MTNFCVILNSVDLAHTLVLAKPPEFENLELHSLSNSRGAELEKSS